MNQSLKQIAPETAITDYPHALSGEQILDGLQAQPNGLTSAEVLKRQQQYGPNALPRKEPPGLFQVFANQFKSPLIYVLVAAAVVSLLIQEFSDAIFISKVGLVVKMASPVQKPLF